MPKKDEYKFTGEVRKQVESFKNHLKTQHLNDNTIRQKTNYAGYHLNWLETERLQAENTRYNDLLNVQFRANLDDILHSLFSVGWYYRLNAAF